MYKITALRSFLMCIFFSLPKGSHQDPNEKRLLHYLLDTYNIFERPVEKHDNPLTVTISAILWQILDLNTQTQILTTSMWLNLQWNDSNLRWTPEEFGNITDIRIPSHEIWSPDILMYNSVDIDFDSTFKTNIVVKQNGEVMYSPPGIFRSTCELDLTWFPFDEQKCYLTFGSWVHDGFKVDLRLMDEDGGSGVDTSNFMHTGEWILQEMSSKRNVDYFSCCAEPFVDITFVVCLKRKHVGYFTNFIVPAVLLVFLALFAFTLPPESGSKLTLGLFTLYMFHMQYKDNFSHLRIDSDTIPFLARFYCWLTFIVSTSVVTTIFILSCHYRNADTRPLPKWFRSLVLIYIPHLMFMSKYRVAQGGKIKAGSNLQSHFCGESKVKKYCSDEDSGSPSKNRNIKPEFSSGDKSERGMSFILKELQVITEVLRQDKDDNEIQREWKYAAVVLDRVCFIVLTLTIVLITVVMFACFVF